MKYYNQLFVSEGLEDKKDKLIEMIESDKILFHIYLLVVPYDSGEQLEIYDISLNHQSLIKDANNLVVGIANNYYDALILVEEIVKKVYTETGTAHIKKYFTE